MAPPEIVSIAHRDGFTVLWHLPRDIQALPKRVGGWRWHGATKKCYPPATCRACVGGVPFNKWWTSDTARVVKFAREAIRRGWKLDVGDDELRARIEADAGREEA